MHVACPYCNQALAVPDHIAGQIARCGLCGNLFTAPVPPWLGAPPSAPSPGAGVTLAPGPPPPQVTIEVPGPPGESAAPPEEPASVSGPAAPTSTVTLPPPAAPPAGPAPAPDGSFGAVPPPGARPPWPAPPTWQYAPYSPPVADRTRARYGTAGGLLLALGLVSILWAGLMGVYVGMGAAGVLEDAERSSPWSGGAPLPSQESQMVTFVVLGILSVGSGILELLAGVRLLRKRTAARGLGLVAAVFGLTSVWTCCVWPFAVAVGIYALVVLGPKPTA